MDPLKTLGYRGSEADNTVRYGANYGLDGANAAAEGIKDYIPTPDTIQDYIEDGRDKALGLADSLGTKGIIAAAATVALVALGGLIVIRVL